MTNDLKVIKKKYGENMSKLCNKLFASLLEVDNLLPSLLLDHFYPSHYLCDDIINNNLVGEFKNYIYSLVDVEKMERTDIGLSPKELLNIAGYTLYECKTEEDIQQFKKYYHPKEALCTFNGNRLKECHVFFAVKKDVDLIKREDFEKPLRQDRYGTSVISIQFTKDGTNTLSIKNRYNHTVNNPDATFSNNLDNIIPGLTKAFEREYDLIQKYVTDYFEIPNYVFIKGKYYKYNLEENNIYYCPDNVIIDKNKLKKYDKEKYILMDYFILDLVNKRIRIYDEYLYDSFVDTIDDIKKIEIVNEKNNKKIKIIPKKGEAVIIILDKQNNIISYTNNNIINLKQCFLINNIKLKELFIPNVLKIADNCLMSNLDLEILFAPNLKEIGNFFLLINKKIKELDLPNVEKINKGFLTYNESLEKINIPNLVKIGQFNFLKNKHDLLNDEFINKKTKILK